MTQQFTSWRQPLQLRQRPVYQIDGDRSFAHGRGDTLHISGADIAYGKHARQTRLQHLRRARKRPVETMRQRIQIAPGEDEALLSSITHPFSQSVRGDAPAMMKT